MTPEVLASALDAVSDAVLVFDRRGSVLHVNRTARELFKPGLPSSMADILRHPLGAAAREQQLPTANVVVIPRQNRQPLLLAEREREAIEQALNQSGWQLAVAARSLGISRTTLWRRLKQYGLTRPEGVAVG